MTDTPPLREPERFEVEAVYSVLTHLSQVMHWALSILPDSPFMWHCITHLEALAESVGERDPVVDAHIHHAAETLDSFRDLHITMSDPVSEAERILLSAAEEGDGPAEA